jgi:hypothetical protein
VIEKARGGLGFSFRFSSLGFVMEKARALLHAIVNSHLDLLFNAT